MHRNKLSILSVCLSDNQSKQNILLLSINLHGRLANELEYLLVPHPLRRPQSIHDLIG